MTSPAIVGLNTILVRLCHPIEGLGGLLSIFFFFFGAMVKLHIVSYCLRCLRITNVFKIYEQSFVLQIINCLIF